jgi:hypothetical protein
MDTEPRSKLQISRGLILDMFVFVVNLFLMRLLVEHFVGLVRDARDGDKVSQFAITIFFISLLVLAPAGAYLARWHFHQRHGVALITIDGLAGCLFSPFIYFGVVVILINVSAGLTLHFLFGTDDLAVGGRITLVVVGLSLAALHTFFVYRYFSPPAPPQTAFMLGPISGLGGDICIFTNMLFFQLLWNTLAMGFSRPVNGSDLFTNLLAAMIGSLLIYFPPRIFYLAEDIKRPRTWFFIVLANIPVIYRAMFGSGHVLKF